MPMDQSERELLQSVLTHQRELQTNMAVIVARLEALERQTQRLYTRMFEGNGSSHEARLLSHEERVCELEDWQKEIRDASTVPAVLRLRMDQLEAWRDGIRNRFWIVALSVFSTALVAAATALIALNRAGALPKGIP